MGCCFQDLFKKARRILTLFSSNFFSVYFVKIYVVHPYSSKYTAIACKKNISDFYMICNQSIAVCWYHFQRCPWCNGYGRLAFAWPYAGVHRSTSLMSSSLLLQQCPACQVRLTCIVFVMGGKWPYSWWLVGCCRQDLFNIAHNILV